MDTFIIYYYFIIYTRIYISAGILIDNKRVWFVQSRSELFRVVIND